MGSNPTPSAIESLAIYIILKVALICRVRAGIRSRNAPERGSPEAASRDFWAFSPFPTLAVDFRDFKSGAEIRRFDGPGTGSTERAQEVFSGRRVDQAGSANPSRVITQCKPRHRHQEFLSFLNHLDRDVPAELAVHLIADNYATHKHPRVKALAGAPPALSHSLHSDLRQLAQPGRTLVRAHHPAGDPAWLVSQRAPIGAEDRIRHSPQSSQTPLRLDRYRRFNLR